MATIDVKEIKGQGDVSLVPFFLLCVVSQGGLRCQEGHVKKANQVFTMLC